MRVEGGARRHVARQPAFARRASTSAASPSAQGGGGHRFAAGFTSDEPAEAVVAAHPRRAVTRPTRYALRPCATDWSSSTSRPAHTSHDVVAQLRKRLRAAARRARGHARSRRDRRAARRARPRDAAAALPAGDRARRTAPASCSASRPTRSTRRARCSSAPRCRSTREQVERAARAFVGDIEQVPPMVSAIKVGGRAVRAGARGRGGRAGRRGRCASSELVVEDFVGGRVPGGDDPGRLLERHLRPHAGGRSRHRARRLRAPRRAAPAARRVVHARRGAPARRDRGRSRRGACSRRPRRCATSNAVVVDGERPRAVAHGATFAAPALLGERDAPGPVRGRRRARRAARGVRTAGRAA